MGKGLGQVSKSKARLGYVTKLISKSNTYMLGGGSATTTFNSALRRQRQAEFL